MVPPTPPRGVATAAQTAVAARPDAVPVAKPPAAELPRPHASGCSRCGTVNPGENNFCSTCGAPLKAQAPNGPAFRAPTPPTPASPAAPPAPAAAAGLAPTAAVPVVPPTAAVPVMPPAPAVPVVPPTAAVPMAPEASLVCPRCRGNNAPRMSFCQFCGARLATHTTEHSGAMPAAAGSGANHARTAQITAQPSRAARLVVIAQDGSPGRHYPLMSEQTDVGREEGAIVLPNDPYVSPRHSRLICRGGRFFVRDLGSVNGVYVRLRSPHRLAHADLVLLGLEVLRFELVSDAERGLGPATEAGAQIFGSPAVPRYARLCQRTVEGVARDIFYLWREETIIGRESGDIVFTGDPFMSRQHASITRSKSDNDFMLRDLGSSNGTYVVIRGEVELFPGDQIRVGQHLFRLEADDGRS